MVAVHLWGCDIKGGVRRKNSLPLRRMNRDDGDDFDDAANTSFVQTTDVANLLLKLKLN